MSDPIISRERVGIVTVQQVVGGMTTTTGDARYAPKADTLTALAGKAAAPIVRYEGNATVTATTTSTTGTQMHSSMGFSATANTVYEIALVMTAAGGAAGFTVGIDAPAGADLMATCNGTGVDGAARLWRLSSASTLSSVAFGAEAYVQVEVRGLLWTGATAGTVIPRIAAATAGQTATVLSACLIAWPAGGA